MSVSDHVLSPPTGFIQPEVERRYVQYMQDHHGELDVPRLCEVMWNSGGRNAIVAMTEMSDILPLIGRIESRVVRLRSLIESLGSDS